MTERPILFSGPMVRAILAGTKTQTRRVVKGLHPDCYTARLHGIDWKFYDQFDRLTQATRCPYGQPGDRLWVREMFQRFTDDGETLYKADPAGFEAMNELKRDECLEAFWRPSIHMPRWASRITLEVTGVRVERLQDISEADARAEGAPSADLASRGECIFPHQGTYRWGFRLLWESINGPDSWGANPWVWVVEFRRITP